MCVSVCSLTWVHGFVMWNWKISSLNRIFLLNLSSLIYTDILVAAGAEAATAAAAAVVGGRVSFVLLV